MVATASLLATRGLALLGLAALGWLLAIAPLRLAALLVGAVLAIPLVLAYPPAGLALLVVAVPFGDPVALSLGTLRLGLPSLLALLTLVAWFGQTALTPGGRIDVPPLVPALLPLLAVLLFTLPGVREFVPGLRELLLWLELAAVYVAASHLLRGPALWLVVASLLAAAALEALVGWYQFFARVGPPSFAIGPFLRAYGTFGQPNPFAGYLNTALPLALGLLLGAWQTRAATDRRLLALAALTVALAGPALLMSMSRGAWLGMAAAVAAMLAAAGHVGRRVLLGSMALALLLAFAATLDLLPPAIVARIADTVAWFGVFDARSVPLTPENYAVVDRMAHWQAAWEMYREHPLLGIGPGQYTVYYPEFRLPLWPDPKIHAHNFYLQTLAETGVVGFLALLIFALATGWHVLCVVRRASGAERGLALGMLGVVAAVGVHSFFDNLFVRGVHTQFALLLGAATALSWLEEARCASPSTTPPR